MLSRVANLVYWTARYLERAENNVRLVDVNSQLVLDLESEQARRPEAAWAPLLYVSSDEESYKKLYPQIDEPGVIKFLLFDERNPSSVFSCLNQARENCRCIRDQITVELWEQINRVFLRIRGESFNDYQRIGPDEYLRTLGNDIQLFYGIADDTLPRHDAWWFFELGRFLERADSVSRILDVKYFTLLPKQQAVGSALDMIQWAAVLQSCSALEAFRKTRRGQITLAGAVEFLLCDNAFPRSIRFSVRQAERALRKVSANDTAHAANRALDLLGKLDDELAALDPKLVIKAGLHEWIDGLQLRLGEVHSAVADTLYFYETKGARIVA